MKRAKAKPAATGRYRVSLHGFSDFERNALTFCLKHAVTREPAYVHVERAADADFIVADASHEALASSVTRGTRMRDTLFVGEHAPPGARSHVERPIDPEQILRALDEMAAEREAPRPVAERPDIVLPLAPRDSDFPTLSEFDIVETTPAAFEHAPVLINLADLEPIVRPRARGAPSTTPATPTPTPIPTPRSVTAPDPHSEPEPVPEPELEPETLAAAEPGGPKATEPAELPHAPPDDAAPPEPVRPVSASARQASIESALKPDEFETISPSAKADAAPVDVPVTARKQPKTTAERAEAKAEARRRSRRARLAQAGRAGAESLRDVLLLDPQRAHADLAAQLEAFGFEVRRTTFCTDALTLVAGMPLAAVFIDVAAGNDEDMDGLELCMEIKNQRVLLAGAVPPIFLLADRDSAAGRVRAKLAGCDALLIRPVTRGDAARALEACDVALPADARRIERP